MAQAPLPRQLLHLDRFGRGVQQGRSPLQLALIVIAPLAAVEQGSAIGAQQRHQVFRHHRCCGNSAGHSQVELAAAVGVAPRFLRPFAAQLHAVCDA